MLKEIGCFCTSLFLNSIHFKSNRFSPYLFVHWGEIFKYVFHVIHIQPFFRKFLEDISPFCGTTDTSVLDIWWRLLWVSKPVWAALFALGKGIHVTHSLRVSSGVTPPDLLVSQSLPCTCKQALVRLKTRPSGVPQSNTLLPLLCKFGSYPT